MKRMVNLVPFHFLLNRMECSERWKRTKWERSVLPFHFTSLHYLLFTLVFCSPFITPFFQEMRKWIMVRFFPFFSFQFTLPSLPLKLSQKQRERKRSERLVLLFSLMKDKGEWWEVNWMKCTLCLYFKQREQDSTIRSHSVLSLHYTYLSSFLFLCL